MPPKQANDGGLELLFLAHSLAVGGAERQLVSLAIELHKRGRRVGVAVMRPGGSFEAELQAAGVAVIDLQQRSSRWSPQVLTRLVREIRARRVNVVYSYLSLPNVAAVLVRAWVKGIRVAWGVRASYVDYRAYSPLFRVADALERCLCKFPDVIIFNSHAGMKYAVDNGYPTDRSIVVPNGVDTSRFSPRAEGRARVRGELGIRKHEQLVGLVARFDVMKDHPGFLRAANIAAQSVPTARFVCVGDGDARRHDQLRRLATELGIAEKVIWVGVRSDMPDVYSALDVLCLSSIGEGFPNAVAEAMACGVPCVATDVGDVRWLIGEHGVVVPPGDPAALARGLLQCLNGRHSGTDEIRTRIVNNFSLVALCDAVEEKLFLRAHQSSATR